MNDLSSTAQGAAIARARQRHCGLTCLAVCLAACSTAPAATVFLQPVNLAYSTSSTLNSPSVLVGDVTSVTDSHPNPAGGGGGTSWYASDWAGQFLSFDFATPSTLLDFHLWDYYDHSTETLRLVLYDDLNGGGNTVYDEILNISPNRGGSQVSVRWDFAFASQLAGVESGRIYALSDTTTNYPNNGFSEIGFTAVPEPSRVVLLLVGVMTCLTRRSRPRLHHTRTP